MIAGKPDRVSEEGETQRLQVFWLSPAKEAWLLGRSFRPRKINELACTTEDRYATWFASQFEKPGVSSVSLRFVAAETNVVSFFRRVSVNL